MKEYWQNWSKIQKYKGNVCQSLLLGRADRNRKMKRTVFILGKILEYLFLAVLLAPFAVLAMVPVVASVAYIAGMLGMALVVVLLMAVLIVAVTTWPFWLCAVIMGFIALAVLLMEVVTAGGEAKESSDHDCQRTGVNPLLALVAGLYLGGVWFGGREG